MYAITGITGQVGGALARALLADGQPVRAVVRDADKGHAWAERGCEVALAEMKDAASLTAAFKGAQGVFILPPSERVCIEPAPGMVRLRAGSQAELLSLLVSAA
jgi:NAD(P)H dehydrogenase (quinone)